MHRLYAQPPHCTSALYLAVVGRARQGGIGGEIGEGISGTAGEGLGGGTAKGDRGGTCGQGTISDAERQEGLDKIKGKEDIESVYLAELTRHQVFLSAQRVLNERLEPGLALFGVA